MHRLACIDLPSFPLQILLRRHPDWQGFPAAVVDHDKPHGSLLWVNEAARDRRILPGLRYAAALSLSGALRAGVVPATEIERAVEEVTLCLQQFTPDVEPLQNEPGTFWLNATGIETLFHSLSAWAHSIRQELTDQKQLHATIVVGWNKFSTLAIAKASRDLVIFATPEEERASLQNVPLERLSLLAKTRDILAKLGVHTLGDFVRLPEAGIAQRFDEETRLLHRQAREELTLPFEPVALSEPLQRDFFFDEAATDRRRLQECIHCLLQSLLEVLARRGEALTEIHLDFKLQHEKREPQRAHHERLQPAAPTTNGDQLMELVRLRLESLRLERGVTDVKLTVCGKPKTSEQLELFALKASRDLAAANRSLARLRAEFGEGIVVYAKLRDGHLPEASFTWEELDRVKPPRPREARSKTSTLVRRIHVPSLQLPARPRHEPDGWMLRGLEQGPVMRVLGPYFISGGWWHRSVQREYHFAETQRGELLWVYFDRLRRRWILQGSVE